jgi:hypothetical protein
MAHRHNDEYVHQHDLVAESHRHRLIEVIEHAHGAHGDDRHGHTHIVMTSVALPGKDGEAHRHRLQAPFEHEHSSSKAGHGHQLGDIEHDASEAHWHPVEITEIEVIWRD